MRTLQESINKVHARFPKVNPKNIDLIIEEYQKSLLKTLLENGHVYVTPDIKLEVIFITPRRYVLRGKDYKSVRLYKIKSTVSDDLYKKISDAYDAFREDIN